MSALARRLPLAGLVAVTAALALVPLGASTAAAPGGPAVELARFGGSHFGSRGLFSSRPALGRGVSRVRTPGRGLLRRIGHALAFVAILHFLFAGSSGLGFLVLLLLIALAVGLMRRRRRAYAPRW
jgi:hypothetical protein